MYRGPLDSGLAVEYNTGAQYPVDLVVYGVGMLSRTELVEHLGIPTVNGLVVGSTLRSAIDAVLAVGDCASFPNAHPGCRTRLKSIKCSTPRITVGMQHHGP